MIKNVIFDFDGTIADSMPIVLRILNKLAPKYGYEALEMEEVALWRAKTSRQIVNDIKVPKFKIPFFLAKFLKELNRSIGAVKPQQGIVEALNNLRNQGYSLHLISSNHEDSIRTFLKKNQIEVFDKIETGVALFGKERKIDYLLRKIKGLKHEAVYVGDETRDIEAAKKARVRSIAVCWGYNTKEALQSLTPDFLASDPKDLLKIIEKI